MARIPDDELERLKKDIPLRSLAEAKGVALKGLGDNLIGKCPFHDDKEPSFVITPSKNLWHCLGACQAGGTVIDFVMKAEGVSFRQAVDLLRGGSLTAGVSPSSPIDFNADDEAAMDQVITYYNQTLKHTPEALEYLEKRGIRNEEAIERFRIGYADRTLGLKLPERSRVAGAKIRDRLARTGLYRDTGREHFNGCLVFPIMDREGKIQHVYGRRIRPTKDSPHMKLPLPQKGIWNMAGVNGEAVILCEAVIDALSFWVNGIKNVTAAQGVGCFLPDHLAAFREGGVKRVYIAYDRDEPGDKATEILAPKLIGEGFEVFRVLFPMGYDANDFILASDPPDKNLAALVRAADWLGKPKVSLLVADPPVPAENKPEPALEPLAVEKPGEAAKKEATGAGENPEPPAFDAPPPAPVAVIPSPPSPVPAAVTEAAAKPTPDLAAKKENATAARKPYQDMPTEITEREVIMTLGDREYRVRGLDKNLAFEVLKVTIRAVRDERYHDDTLDLYQARTRHTYITQAAKELCVDPEVVKKDLAKVLFKLEELQEELIKKTLKPEKKEFVMDGRDRQKALELLKDPNLLKRILKDFEDYGIVGEETNKLACYLSAISRKLEDPLAILIQSSSSAGKSALMDAALAFMPEEEKIKYSAMTGQSLFYMNGADLKHKILAIAEEEGAQKAGYALKLLQSEGVLTIASTGKDPKTGRLVTQDYKVEGPVMIFMTTTGIEIDDELLNRCIVLTVNEDRDQTKAIHEKQRQNQTLGGLLNRRDCRETLHAHQNAQRLLRPLLVANPYADKLTFINDRTRTRRDHLKYLTLIRAIALLHQYQRPIRTINHQGAIVQYIDVTLEDIAVANDLANEVLGRTLDELPPQTRKLLFAIEEYVGAKCKEAKIDHSDFHFTRREIREYCRASATQINIHLQRLVDLEYVYTRQGKNGQNFVYELVYQGEGREKQKFMLGLFDPRTLKCNYNDNLSGVKADLSGRFRGAFGPLSATFRGGPITPPTSDNATPEGVPDKKDENAHLESPKTGSYSYSESGE